MNFLRLFLLVLLAVLLPLQGALARQAGGCVPQQAPGVHAMSARHAMPATHEDHYDEGTASGHHLGAAGACSFCALSCASVAAADPVALLDASAVTGRVSFPALHPPRASHLSPGLERPPRAA